MAGHGSKRLMDVKEEAEPEEEYGVENDGAGRVVQGGARGAYINLQPERRTPGVRTQRKPLPKKKRIIPKPQKAL